MSRLETGGVRELWKISYPMMISFFSMMLMIFVDRLFLSWYSLDALNASVQAGTLAWGIILGWMTMATMSEVFVAQYNGSKQYDKIGIPVWQMTWLCLLSALFFLPFGFWGTGLFYSSATHPQEAIYFSYLMYFGPIFALVPALGGFFIGRGKTGIMQWMAILGNAVNILLDPIFIFGIKGWIPSMGIVGAAIATGIGNVIQVAILFAFFMKADYRNLFGTNKIAFHAKTFFKSVKIGLPPSIFVTLELSAWAIFYYMMSLVSPMHILVSGVCQSMLILFIFFGMGVEKGAIALAGNFIGEGKPEKIQRVIRSGLILIGIYFLVSSIFLIFYPFPLIDWFFSGSAFAAEVPKVTLAAAELAKTKEMIQFGMICVAFMILFENVRWVFNGILTAAGDTLFLLIAGAINVWCFMIMPTYFFVLRSGGSIKIAFLIWPLYALVATVVIGIRFAQGKWKKKSLIEAEENKASSINKGLDEA